MFNSGDGNHVEKSKSQKRKDKVQAKREEKRLAKEIARQKAIKDHYEREMALCQRNFIKCENKWNYVFEQFTCKDLKWEFSAFKEYFSTWLNIKNLEFQLLRESFEDLPEENRLLATGFLSALDNLIDIYHTRVEGCREISVDSYTQQQTYFETNQKILTAKLNQDIDKMNNIVLYQKEKEELVQSLAKEKQDALLLDLDSQNFTDIEKLEEDFDEMVEWLLMNLQVKIQTYLFTNNTKYQAYEQLKEKENKDIEKLFKTRFEIKKLEQKISFFKQKLRALNYDYDIPKLIADKRALLCELVTKGRKMSELEKEDREKLKLLSTTSKQSITYLKSVWERRRKIIDLKFMCGKYESNADAPKFLHLDTLDNFWGQLEIIRLKKKIRELCQENGKLKLSLVKVLQQCKE